MVSKYLESSVRQYATHSVYLIDRSYALDFKGLNYKTIFLEYPEIQKIALQLGANPTGTDSSGVPKYTLPMIHDLSTGTVIAESLDIVEYLDRAYPDRARVVPPASSSLLRALNIALYAVIPDVFWELTTAAILHDHLFNPPSEEYFKPLREEDFGKSIEEIVSLWSDSDRKEQALQAIEKGFAKVDTWYSKDASRYFVGQTWSFADFIIAGRLAYARSIFGRESNEWKQMGSWNGGRWGRRMDELDQFSRLD